MSDVDDHDDEELRSRAWTAMAIVATLAALVALGGLSVLVIVPALSGDDNGRASVQPKATVRSGVVAVSIESTAPVAAGPIEVTTTTVSPATTEPPATTVPATTEPATTEPPTTTEPATTTTTVAPTTTLPPSSPEAAALVEQFTPATLPDGRPVTVLIVFEDQRVTLTGAVPSRAVAQRLVEFATDYRLTPATVVDSLTIDPDAHADGGARIVEFNAVTFVDDADVIVPDHAGQLDRLVGVLTDAGDLTVHVVGHTDQHGEPTRNFVISQRRARAVVDYLVGRGIERARLSTQPAGESMPLSTASTPEADRLNRRTEFVLYGLLDG